MTTGGLLSQTKRRRGTFPAAFFRFAGRFVLAETRLSPFPNILSRRCNTGRPAVREGVEGARHTPQLAANRVWAFFSISTPFHLLRIKTMKASMTILVCSLDGWFSRSGHHECLGVPRGIWWLRRLQQPFLSHLRAASLRQGAGHRCSVVRSGPFRRCRDAGRLLVLDLFT